MIYNNLLFFESFILLSSTFEHFKCILAFWCVLYCKLLFWMRLSYSVYFLYILTCFKYSFDLFLKCPEVWTLFARSIFWEFWGFGGVLNGPPHPHPRCKCQSSLRGKRYGILFFLVGFMKIWANLLRSCKNMFWITYHFY